MLTGIDLSHCQTTTPPLAGLDFVFVKATDGVGKDPLYDMHCANVLKAGKVLGAYAFGYNLSPAYSPVDQAAALLTIAPNIKLLALDLEYSKIPMTLAQGAAFIAFVHAAGHKIGLYSSDSGFPNLGQDWNWVANWSKAPTRPWTFWQSQGSPLDQDVFAGDMTALLALAGKDAMPALGWKITAFESGTVTIKGVGHSAVRLSDGVYIAQTNGTSRPYAAKIALDTQLYGGIAGADRRNGYLIGEAVCILLASDVTAVPNAVPTPPVDTAALQKTAFNNAISYAVTAVQGLTKP